MLYPLTFLGAAVLFMVVALASNEPIFYWLSGWVACRGWALLVDYVVGEAS